MGRGTPSGAPPSRGGSLLLRFMLTRALLMTSSHSKAADSEQVVQAMLSQSENVGTGGAGAGAAATRGAGAAAAAATAADTAAADPIPDVECPICGEDIFFAKEETYGAVTPCFCVFCRSCADGCVGQECPMVATTGCASHGKNIHVDGVANYVIHAPICDDAVRGNFKAPH